MRTKEQEYRLIDFRTALDAIECVTECELIPAEFFCKRDAERLFAAYNSIFVRFLKAEAQPQIVEMANPRLAPTEENGFPPAH